MEVGKCYFSSDNDGYGRETIIRIETVGKIGITFRSWVWDTWSGIGEARYEQLSKELIEISCPVIYKEIKR